MTAVRRTAAAVVLLAVWGAPATLVPRPAMAAADEISVSSNGTVWVDELSGSLFDARDRWVPGDEETRSFWVRNDGPTGARLTVSVESTDTDRLLAADDIDLSARAEGRAWVELRNGVPSQALTSSALERRGTARVDLRATFSQASTNPSQTRRLPLRFVVTLTQDTAAHTKHQDARHGGVIPQTGAEVALWLAWLATGALAVGLFLVAGRRTHDQGAEQ